MNLLFNFALALGLTAPLVAFGDTTVCSSPDQKFFFSHDRSNGGAARDEKNIVYNGKNAQSDNPNDNVIDILFANDTQIAQEQVGNGTATIYSAIVAANFKTADGEQVSVNREWVICREEKYPICNECPVAPRESSVAPNLNQAFALMATAAAGRPCKAPKVKCEYRSGGGAVGSTPSYEEVCVSPANKKKINCGKAIPKGKRP